MPSRSGRPLGDAPHETPDSVYRWLTAALVAVACGLVLLGTEGILEYRSERTPLALRREAATKLGLAFDPRDRFDVLRDYRARGVVAMPMLGVRWFEQEYAALVGGPPPLLPLTGVSHTKTVTCNEDGHWGSFESDRYGFNNPDSAWRQRPDVVLIGDSFSQGQCVRGEHDLGAGLRQRGHSALALGVGGNGPLLDDAVFLEYGLPLRPKFVIWEFFDNDIDDLQGEMGMPTVARYLPPGTTQSLMAREGARDSLVRDIFERALAHPDKLPVRPPVRQRLRMFLTLGAMRQLAAQAWRASRPQVDGRSTATIRRILAAARDSLAAHDGTLIVAYFPSWEHFRFQLRLSRELRDSLAAVAGGLAVPFVDVAGALRAGGDVWPAFALGRTFSTHYSAEGYRRVAVGLDSVLRAQVPHAATTQP